MGNSCSSSCISKGDKLSCIFGSCQNEGCAGVCNSAEAKKIEDIIDESLKRFVHEHLHPIIEAKVGKTLADLVEVNAIKLIDIDVIPREEKLKPQAVLNEEKKESASE